MCVDAAMEVPTMIFLDDERSAKLRPEILKYFVSSVMTDSERAQFLGLPSGCRIRENAKILAQEKFECGECVWIGERAILDAQGGLKIGDHTTIGSNVMVWSHASYLTNLAMDNGGGSPLIRKAPTAIGDGCFIGGPSVIYPGVTIGNRVVVLPMSVVTRDVPSNSMVGGSPAKMIREITDEWIQAQVEKALAENQASE
jgi:acetyltransferase-like isoleucine patch superfamily enzyme